MNKGNVLTFEDILLREDMAIAITNLWVSWKGQRTEWEEEKQELRNYLFATDTTTTSNNALPWKNSTTVPKLTQIRDNLHANYVEALFPNAEWLLWEGDSEEDVKKDKANLIENYMRNKLHSSKFKGIISRLLLDYIDYGNAFGGIEFVKEIKTDPVDGEVHTIYEGPKLYRISPYDIVFDLTASDFANAPKITRSIFTLGELATEIENKPEMKYKQEALDKARSTRGDVRAAVDNGDLKKDDGINVDGFGSFKDYYNSGFVELLEYEGDIYDPISDTLYKDHVLTIIDRSFVLRFEPNKSWLGRSYKQHVAWRLRPDNLMGMGPLDNLVGMQYRIDHLENLKADVFDMIAFPMLKISGLVEDFNFQPGERIYLGDDGDVNFLVPDTTALNADFQIAELERKMEELAGAPREAMGIRTPGEKTKFEVQSLQSAAGRIFQHKVSQFEENFVEPLINGMFEIALRNLRGKELIKTQDPATGAFLFDEVTKDDLTGKGSLRPIGARHFAEQARKVQELVSFFNSGIIDRPTIAPHVSGLKTLQLFEKLLDLGNENIFAENAALDEAAKVQQYQNTLQDQTEVNAVTPTEADEEEIPLG